ncbi:hypothetical protein BX666DRAFT_1923768 [Dichotomocladium elegans]|nr:hypothetical protein BX666DRAFT_1923768 [Dichotomocladium elegans]
MLSSIIWMATLVWSLALAQSSVDDTGFQSNDNQSANKEESWLKKNDRYIFIIVIGLVLLGLIIFYIVKSVKGMRKRLASENEKHQYMLDQATASHPPYYPQQQPQHLQQEPQPYPPQTNGYQKFDTAHTHRY